MTHYDVIIALLFGFLAGGLLVFVLCSVCWGQTELREASQERKQLPQWNNPFYWDTLQTVEMLPTKNCHQCQQDQDEQGQAS